MKLEILYFSMLLTISTGSIIIQTGSVTKQTNFSHTVITNNVLSITGNVRSTLQCLMLCLTMQDCVSVFYRQVSRRCQFHDVLFLSPQDGQEENGTKYYSLSTGSCPRGYIHARHLDLCYQVHLNWVNYEDSKADCASRNEHLIVIDSQDKQDHLSKQLLSSSEATVEDYYIDGNDADTEDQWVYHDGRPITFFAWDEGWPRTKTPDWAYLVATKTGAAFPWQHRRKGERHYYLCQKDI